MLPSEPRPPVSRRIATLGLLVVAAIGLSACQLWRQPAGASGSSATSRMPAASQAPAASPRPAARPAASTQGAPGAMPAAAPAVPPAAAPAAPAPAAATTAPTPPPLEPVPFDEAIQRAASALFTSAEKVPDIAPNPPRPVIIDPLIDGNSAQQTVASDSMGRKLADVIGGHRKFEVAPFRLSTLDRNPLLLVGTLTAINAKADPQMRNDLYRVCLTLVDMRTRTVIAKGVARATEQTVDATPLPYYADSPTWVKDRTADGYIRTCQGIKVGQPADALYIETIPASMTIDEALRAYNQKDYTDAQRLYRTALALPGGEQLRVVNGLYLTSWRLRQPREAEDAFAKIVTRSLQDRDLGVRFLFKPNSTDFIDDRDLRAQYRMWNRVLAQRIDDTRDCVAVVGHASKTGSDAYNDMLSLRRAQAIARNLERQNAGLTKILSTRGMGSRQTIIGSGTDDLRDSLDRRVEFKVTDCP